jgi:Fe-S oxidoreductase
MNAKNANKTLAKFSEECIQCGACLNTCTLLNDLGLTPGEIANVIIQDHVDEACLAAIQRCDLCGRCSQECLVNLDPSDMIKAAREVLILKGKINPEDYDSMLVDRDWNFFSIYRETYGIDYHDLFTINSEAIFFPGCTLMCYSPELTRAAFKWLQGTGLEVGFSDLCCGKPLDSIGLTADADHYLDRLRNQIKAAGASQLITACPNCEAHLKAYLTGVEVRSIYSMLLEAGIHLEGTTKLTFHDSCPDRHNIINPENVRKLLAGYPQVEMASHGKDAICCGSGGIVSMVDPDLCSARARRRMAEFSAAGADVCITSCMACYHRLGGVSQLGQVRHCLEFVFDVRVDYEQIERNTQAMWEGSQGEINLLRLAQKHISQTD